MQVVVIDLQVCASGVVQRGPSSGYWRRRGLPGRLLSLDGRVDERVDGRVDWGGLSLLPALPG